MIALKAGDRVQTPDGEGTIADFEVWPPLRGGRPKEIWSSYDRPLPEGWFIRVGVAGNHHQLDIAYYPPKKITLL